MVSTRESIKRAADSVNGLSDKANNTLNEAGIYAAIIACSLGIIAGVAVLSFIAYIWRD